MSLLEEQLEEIRKKTAAVGVTPEMAQARRPARGLLGIEPPRHWTEKAIEEDGKGKFFGKMLLGGFTGLTPLLFPEMIGSRARYKAELARNYEKMQDAQERQMLNNERHVQPDDVRHSDDANGNARLCLRYLPGQRGGYLADRMQGLPI